MLANVRPAGASGADGLFREIVVTGVLHNDGVVSANERIDDAGDCGCDVVAVLTSGGCDEDNNCGDDVSCAIAALNGNEDDGLGGTMAETSALTCENCCC